MKPNDFPANEVIRLERLRRLRIMDTAAEAVLDGFTETAAAMCGSPISLVSLVDERRQWFKSAVGLPQGNETPREVAFCAHAIEQDELFEVPDARLDARFKDNPFVTGPANVVHYAGMPLLMPEGERIGTLCVINNIPASLTPWQRQCLRSLAKNVVDVLLLREKELELSEERMLSGAAQLARMVPVGLFWTDERGSVVGCNDQFASLVGRSEQEITGRAWDHYAPAAEKGEVWRLALEMGSGFSGMASTRPATDLAPRWLKYQLLPAHSADTPEIKFAGAVVDVTSEQENLRKLGEREAQLRAALEAADEANCAKSDFLATMSHEIRTPINGVIGLSHLLAGSELPTKEREYVKGIDNCARSLLALVDNILDLSKIEARHLTLETLDVDVRSLTDELRSIFEARAQDKGIGFDVVVRPTVPQAIVSDPTRLRQILLNLLGNAHKFTEKGGFALTIATEAAQSGPEITFAVKDSGIGIDEESQKRLFERYTQADTSTTRKYHGTGLGLAIAKQLAKLMGGDVQLRSAPGEGSTFTLRIPLVVATSAEKATARKCCSATERLQDARILLVEDNDINQIVCQGLLASMGFENVSIVGDGTEALTACEASTFDLILMDCQMPRMDGFTATGHLRSSGVTTPILALTANAMSGDRDRCLQAGMTDYLSKPVDPEILRQKVEQHLRHALIARCGSYEPEEEAPANLAVDFDSDTVMQRFMGDALIFSHARGIFLKQSTAQVDTIISALRKQDNCAVCAAAHKFRGAAATLGAQRIVQLCQELEDARGAVRQADAWRSKLMASLERFELLSNVPREAHV